MYNERGDAMPRKPMNENDPLVPKQISLPNSLKLKLKRAAEASGKSESEIVREALAEKLAKDKSADL
jgi:hypothetical protein